MKRQVVTLSVAKVRECLGSPTWYLWAKCAKEIGLPPRSRSLTLQQSKIVVGWFSLYSQHSKDRSATRCLAAYYACLSTGMILIPAMTGAEILALRDRPSKATLYRRGLKKANCYTATEVEILLR